MNICFGVGGCGELQDQIWSYMLFQGMNFILGICFICCVLFFSCSLEFWVWVDRFVCIIILEILNVNLFFVERIFLRKWSMLFLDTVVQVLGDGMQGMRKWGFYRMLSIEKGFCKINVFVGIYRGWGIEQGKGDQKGEYLFIYLTNVY